MKALRASLAQLLVVAAVACLVGCGKVELQPTPTGIGHGLETPPAPMDPSVQGAPAVPASTLPILPSSGCGKARPAEQVQTIPGTREGYTEWHVQLTGETLGDPEPSKAGDLQFFVRVPADYDESHPYRVVYIGSEYGAALSGNTRTYPLFDEAQGGTEQAVYVGLSVWGADGGYDDLAGVQSTAWEAFDLIHTFVEQTYCVDNNRIYALGHHPGAALAFMWGCYFGGLSSPPLDAPDEELGLTSRKFSPKWEVRGFGGVAGVENLSGTDSSLPMPCNGHTAQLVIHDELDKSVLLGAAIAAFNLNLQTNGCTGNYADGPKEPWAPAESIAGLKNGTCQRYTGCPAETAANYPLIFCTTSGLGHGDQSASVIPAFKQFFDSMDPVGASNTL